jgi:glutamate--cysteine ligase
MVALLTGLLYDPTALEEADALLRKVSFEAASEARTELVTRGLAANYGPYRGFELAHELVTIAKAGLKRRTRVVDGADESPFLSALEALLADQTNPAALLLQRFGESPDRNQLLEAFA